MGVAVSDIPSTLCTTTSIQHLTQTQHDKQWRPLTGITLTNADKTARRRTQPQLLSNMSHSNHTCIKMDEEMPLKTVPGSVDPQNGVTIAAAKKSGLRAAACCNDKHHRRLAVCSIICGISCIGIKALINSVKAETDPTASIRFSRRAKKLAILSIVTWLALLALAPMLMALFSYVVTLQD